MNLDQYKQVLQNNLIHGEQSRRSTQERRAVFAFDYPDKGRVWGIDISSWDGNVELQKTKEYGAAFVFIKAMDGTVHSKFFPENRERAVAAKLFHAPYAWLYRDANVSCVAQARAYSELIKKYPSDLPPAIDFEWTRWLGKASNPTYKDLDLWVTEFLRLGNRKPLLYTAAGFADAYGRIPVSLKDKFEGLWVANFGVKNPQLPLGFTTYLFHQQTDLGDAMTIAPNDRRKMELDINYFNGDVAALEKLAGKSFTPPPPAQNKPKKRVVIEGDFVIREEMQA